MKEYEIGKILKGIYGRSMDRYRREYKYIERVWMDIEKYRSLLREYG